MNPVTKEVYTSKKKTTQPKAVHVDSNDEIHDIIKDKAQHKVLKQAKLSIAGQVREHNAPGTVAKAKGKATPIGIKEQEVMNREGISKENLDATI